jgi:ataxia telangiectasia mutated family protein
MLHDGPFSLVPGKLSSKFLLCGSLLTICSCAFQNPARSPALHEQWIAIFHSASRPLTVEKSSRAASYLLFVLLAQNVLAYGDVAPIAQTIVSSTELQGPTELTDSSLALLRLLLDTRSAENPSSAIATAERLVHWLFQKWTPSKLFL